MKNENQILKYLTTTQESAILPKCHVYAKEIKSKERLL
jgi:hypothetical protein